MLGDPQLTYIRSMRSTPMSKALAHHKQKSHPDNKCGFFEMFTIKKTYLIKIIFLTSEKSPEVSL